MFPLLRSDLSIEKTDQSGQVQYLITEPTQGRSYRLYEVEYLIAKMFDGQTDPKAALLRAQSELGFDANEEDFTRFIEQLVELGFISEPTAGTVAAPSTAIFSEAPADSLEHEKERLVRSGLLHVKQGLFAQARDHFLAAKKCDASDGKIAVMLNHFDVVGEDNGPSELEYLWKQSSHLYPELCAEIGNPGSGVAPIPVEHEAGRERSVRPQRNWTSILGMSVLALALLAVVGFGVRATLFPSRKLVVLDRARAQKVNTYFDAQVKERLPKRKWVQKFGKAGVVAEVRHKSNEAVKAGKVVARLALPAPLEKSYKAARTQRQVLEKTQLALSLQVERELAAVNDKVAALQALKDKLKAAKDGGQRKDAAALDKRVAAASKDLAKARAQSLKPRTMKDKIDKQVRAAEAVEAKVIAAAGWAFIRAPEDSVLAEVGVRAGGKATESSEIVFVDRAAIHFVFAGKDERLKSLQKGGGARLQSGQGIMVSGTMVESADGRYVVEVDTELEEFGRGDAKEVLLVKEVINDAVVVAASAKVDDESVWIQGGEQVYRKKVTWIEVRGKDAFARAGLKAGDVVVAGPPEVFSQLADGDRITSIDGVQP